MDDRQPQELTISRKNLLSSGFELLILQKVPHHLSCTFNAHVENKRRLRRRVSILSVLGASINFIILLDILKKSENFRLQ